MAINSVNSAGFEYSVVSTFNRATYLLYCQNHLCQCESWICKGAMFLDIPFEILCKPYS